MSEFVIDVAELRDSVRRLLDAECDSHAVRAAIEGDASVRARLWQHAVELGWLGIAIDEAHGGLGQGFAQVAVLYEELGRCTSPLALLPTLLAAQAIQQAGSDVQQSRWLAAIAAGDITAAVALPSPDKAAVMALSQEGHLSGSVSGVIDGDLANVLLLPVMVGGAQQLVIVDRVATGLSVTHRPSIDQTRRLCDVRADDVALDGERLLPLTESMWRALTDHACLALACDAIGGAARILDITVEYLKTRQQFGRPIGSFQALKHRCANWKILLEAATALGNFAVNDEDDVELWAASAKYYACDAYAAIAGDAIQLHGGIGFTWEHDCHLFFKRARLNQALWGDASVQKDRIAQRLFHERGVPQ